MRTQSWSASWDALKYAVTEKWYIFLENILYFLWQVKQNLMIWYWYLHSSCPWTCPCSLPPPLPTSWSTFPWPWESSTGDPEEMITSTKIIILATINLSHLVPLMPVPVLGPIDQEGLCSWLHPRHHSRSQGGHKVDEGRHSFEERRPQWIQIHHWWSQVKTYKVCLFTVTLWI